MIKKIIIFCGLIFLSGCYSDIVNDVTMRESIKIESILIENGILPQSIRDRDGYTIRVRQQDRLKAVSILSFYELPSKAPVDIETLFPPGELVASPFAEKNRLIYGVSSNLKRTIETIPGVISASVDLAYLTEAKSSSNNKASVVVVYQEPLQVSANFIEQIKAIVVNANPNISFGDVSVSAFKKEFTPITKDLIPKDVKSIDVYLYVLFAVFIVLVIGMVVYNYGISRVNRSKS